MKCPKCGSQKHVKSGFVKGVQRHKCKGCACQFTRSIPRGRPHKQKLLAITLYAYGLSMRAIGKILGVSTPGILGWIRRYAKAHYEKIVPEDGAALVLELDEMWHYLGKKQKVLGLESAGF